MERRRRLGGRRRHTRSGVRALFIGMWVERRFVHVNAMTRSRHGHRYGGDTIGRAAMVSAAGVRAWRVAQGERVGMAVGASPDSHASVVWHLRGPRRPCWAHGMGPRRRRTCRARRATLWSAELRWMVLCFGYVLQLSFFSKIRNISAPRSE
jgi:hypothetical protein